MAFKKLEYKHWKTNISSKHLINKTFLKTHKKKKKKLIACFIITSKMACNVVWPLNALKLTYWGKHNDINPIAWYKTISVFICVWCSMDLSRFYGMVIHDAGRAQAVLVGYPFIQRYIYIYIDHKCPSLYSKIRMYPDIIQI